MRIALTGTSSTGKSTLAQALMVDSEFAQRISRFVTTDARGLLEQLGHRSMDKMTRTQLRDFQLLYLGVKSKLELELDDYVTDRSFVDVAAYWLIRDAFDLPQKDKEPFIERCRLGALRYTHHFYLPPGIIKFQSDGYRSENHAFHLAIDKEICRLLARWGIPYITISEKEIAARVHIVKQSIGVGIDH